MSFSEFVDADQRLVILRALGEQLDATLNEVLLQRALESWGHAVARDRVKSHLRWLADVGAVSLKEQAGYLIASLTSRGEDHIKRRMPIDGIAHPGLGGA